MKKLFIFAFLIVISFAVSCSEPKCTEHLFGEWQIKTEATCIDEGLEVRSCERCEFEEEKIIATKRIVDISFFILNSPFYYFMFSNLEKRQLYPLSSDSKTNSTVLVLNLEVSSGAFSKVVLSAGTSSKDL